MLRYKDIKRTTCAYAHCAARTLGLKGHHTDPISLQDDMRMRTLGLKGHHTDPISLQGYAFASSASQINLITRIQFQISQSAKQMPRPRLTDAIQWRVNYILYLAGQDH
jgi:hypothetical protein